MASTLVVNKIKGGSSGVALTLPTTDGSAGQLLKTDGSAVLGWATDVDTGITSVAADTTPQLGGDLDCNGAQIQWSKGADVVSATALPVLTDGNYFDVTGTTAVTSINTTGGAGTLIKLHFDAILILTHHATDLVLPGGANITTAAGDEAEFIEYAAGDYRCTSYSKADGTSVVAAGGGKVLQVVSTTKTDTYCLGSTTFTNVPGLVLSITPTSSTSKILVTVDAQIGGYGGYNNKFRLAKGGSAIGAGPSGGGLSRTNNQYEIEGESLSYLDSPATTSATEYSFQISGESSSSNICVNRREASTSWQVSSTITLMEIGA